MISTEPETSLATQYKKLALTILLGVWMLGLSVFYLLRFSFEVYYGMTSGTHGSSGGF